MKASHDPRHLKRRMIVQELFSWQFNKKSSLDKEAKKIVKNLPEIDKHIASGASSRPFSEINSIDLAILRLATFELIMEGTAPYKVIVDEAVELAKEFGAESTPSFVNGVLGKIISNSGIDKIGS